MKKIKSRGIITDLIHPYILWAEVIYMEGDFGQPKAEAKEMTRMRMRMAKQIAIQIFFCMKRDTKRSILTRAELHQMQPQRHHEVDILDS